MSMKATSKKMKILNSKFLVFFIFFSFGFSNDQSLEISDINLSTTGIRQGDVFNIDLDITSPRKFDNLTALFRIEDESGRVLALLQTDFFSAKPQVKTNNRFTFRWVDLGTQRTGSLKLANASIIQHLDSEHKRTLADRDLSLDLQIIPAKNEIQRMFISRENSIWWLTEMGRVDNLMTRRNGLAGCTIFGGIIETDIRNDRLVSDGGNGRCYWEITGYTVRQLALEYERTGIGRFLEMARHSADSIARFTETNNSPPNLHGSLPTFLHYDGRPAETYYLDKAMLFDHGQILMGLLELVRVMESTGFQDTEIKPYRDIAKNIGAFMMRARDRSGQKIPFYIEHLTGAASEELEGTTKVVIGFGLLFQLTKDEKIRKAALDHLDRVLNNSEPYRGLDHHGRSYNAYGFIRGFEDYLDPAYLQEAEKWLEQVAMDMDAGGMLTPEYEYSTIPAQAQLIRNAVLLWKLTGDFQFLNWAERSVKFLTDSPDPWTYRQPVLKLGRYYREAGGLFNNIEENEVCSWASIFHIDAMYHYLSQTYGHIYVDKDQTISTIGPVKISRVEDGVDVLIRGNPNENTGIYFDGHNSVKSIKVGGKEFSYYSAKTARIPPFRGPRVVRISFGQSDKARIIQTNSLILNADVKNSLLNIRLKGVEKTQGTIKVHWPFSAPTISIDDNTVTSTSWMLDPENSILTFNYSHTGKEQALEITADK